MMKSILKLIQEWIDKKKVGKITISFFKGGISHVKKEEVIKLIK